MKAGRAGKARQKLRYRWIVRVRKAWLAETFKGDNPKKYMIRSV